LFLNRDRLPNVGTLLDARKNTHLRASTRWNLKPDQGKTDAAHRFDNVRNQSLADRIIAVRRGSRDRQL
jgi:hypothetical protein